jgi:hypothetical protein
MKRVDGSYSEFRMTESWFSPERAFRLMPPGRLRQDIELIEATK